MALTHQHVSTPIGLITVVASEDGVFRVLFDGETPPPETDPGSLPYADRIRRYFSHHGDLATLPIAAEALSDCSAFSRDVLLALHRVPYADTVAYAELAALAGHPRAVRAVASVCAKNPVPLIIPCHRVIRADGSFGRYRGGSNAKKWLIEHEQGNRDAIRGV